jgi:membrane-associated phospholipid phosphatase
VTVPARTGPARTGPVPQPGNGLIPKRFRLAALVIVAACCITVGVLGALFYHGSTPTALDEAVFRSVWPHRVGLDPLVSVGDTVPMTLLTAVLCYCCLALRRYRGAIMVALAVPLASGITELLKHVIHRIYLGFLSFPSGHTTATFALITCVAVLLIDPPATRAPASMRIVLALLSLGFGVMVALGLVAIRFHYFTDTIAGAAVGIGVTLAIALALDLAIARRRRGQAVAAGPATPARSPEPVRHHG